MPPKRYLRGTDGIDRRIGLDPRIIIRPLGMDTQQYSFTSLPPAAALFNKSDLSDITLCVGENVFHAHRLILCAGSDVFRHMLDQKWKESSSKELTLDEDEDSTRVFHHFLQFFYTGQIVIQESHVIPLFMLADKYNVKALYEECVRIIEKELKVFTVRSNHNAGRSSPTKTKNDSTTVQPSVSEDFAYSGVSTDSDTSDEDYFCVKKSSHSLLMPVTLVPSKTFPINLVLKMLHLSSSPRLTAAARYNLQARLGHQVMMGNYALWNDLEQDLVKDMLTDDYFYCNEYSLFRACIAWIQYRESRQCVSVISDVLCGVRYATLSTDELYEVERNDLVKECPSAEDLVHQAIRYKLFQNCLKASDQENWCGSQFQARKYREN